MQYCGGKFRLKKEMHKFFNAKLKEKTAFVDLFCGACNIVEGVKAEIKIANDINPYLIKMFNALVYENWEPPTETITKEEYEIIKKTKPLEPLTGFVGVACSFGGMWFTSFARSKKEDYTKAGRNSLIKQRNLLNGVKFECKDYRAVEIPKGSVVYCDIPYNTPGTSKMYIGGGFDHKAFYEWVDENKTNYDIYISEYIENVPKGFEVVWQKQHKQSLNNAKHLKTDVLITPIK